MKLDFTALQDIAPETAQDRPEDAGSTLPGISTLQEEKTDTGETGRPAGALCEGITTLQEADRLKRAIIDDLGTGEDLQEVLLTAVDCIGILSQDAGIYSQCKDLLRDGYGYQLREDLQEVRDRIAETEKALRRDDLAPAKVRIFQRMLDTYRETEKDLQKRIDALQGIEPPADLSGKDWHELTPPEREAELQRYETDYPDSVNAVIKNLPYSREQIATAGQVIRTIKEALDNIDRARGYKNSWGNTNPGELLELIERQARKRQNC